jgi:hypothetical protein
MDSCNTGTEIVHARAQRGQNQALDWLATQQHTTASELIRQMPLSELIGAGVLLGESEQVASRG